MSLEKSAPEPIQEMLQPLVDGKFKFACHPGVPCFTECCRALKLMLTPYDILRLKNRLGLDSGTFLDDYCDTQVDEQRDLPVITLQMRDDERQTCPFVSESGCTLYEDRPAACRIYPLARATRMHRMHGTVQEDYFVLHEKHCMGFQEDRDWSTSEWIQDQGLDLYHELNNLWMEFITHPKLREGPALSMKQQQMFFMASYNLDKFREFIMKSRFLQVFELSDEEAEAVRESDEALLRLAFKWLSFSLLSQPVLTMREAPSNP